MGPDHMAYDLFISYSRRNNRDGQVTALVERISDDFRAFAGRELKAFLDVNEIEGMDDWQHRIQRSLRDSYLFLAVLSPSYLESSYCHWEWEDYVRYEAMRQCLLEGVAPVFFVTLPDAATPFANQAIAQWTKEILQRQTFDLRPWYDEGQNALRREEVQAALQALQDSVHRRLDRAERSLRSPANILEHNPQFVGRVRELSDLRNALTKNKLGVVGAIGVAAVQGLGGMGKTELALAYAHAFAWDYPGGRWQLHCEGIGDLRLAMRQLASPLQFEFTDEENKDLHQSFERVLSELSRRERCLLLLDNVSDTAILEPEYLGRLPRGGHVDIIATTRLAPREIPGSAQNQTFIAVDELPEEDALALMRSHQPEGRFPSASEDEHARAIVKVLEGFTLAIETAAIYLGRYVTEVTCGQFLADLKEALLEKSEEIAGDKTVAVRHREKLLEGTLEFTLRRLTAEAIHVLTLASLLPADQIALPWLREVGALAFPSFKAVDVGENESGFSEAVDQLRGVRLFQALDRNSPVQTNDELGGSNAPVVRMHRLVQELIKKKRGSEVSTLEPEVLAEIRSRAASLLEGWVEQDSRWQIQPLAACAWQWMERPGDDGPWLANSLVAGPLIHLDDFPEAERLMRRALSLNQRRFDAYHIEVASSLINLAGVLARTNRVSEAEPLQRRALTIHERELGREHTQVAGDLSGLALMLRDTNRSWEAEELMRRALDISENRLGPTHPDVARTLNNLALTLMDTNRLKEAEPLFRRALAIDTQNLGASHPTLANRLHNLAGVLIATNQLAEAESLLRQALIIGERTFGPEHPGVSSALNSLAVLLYETNRLDEAEPLLQRALRIDEKSLGRNHPQIASRLGNLASLLKAMNRVSEAEALLRRALAIHEESYGPHHTAVALDLDNLASLLQQTNRPAEAEPLFRRAIVILEETPGRGDLQLGTCLNNLALLLEATNRVDEAEELMRRGLTIQEKNLGPEHPYVATALNNLANLLDDMKRQKEAEPLHRRVLEILLRSSVANDRPHPHLQPAIDRYASALQRTANNQDKLLQELNAVGKPFGMRFWFGKRFHASKDESGNSGAVTGNDSEAEI